MSDKFDKTKITLINNGPILIKGAFKIVGRDGMEIILDDQHKKEGLYLCRCGNSKQLPYCDGSHKG